MNKERTDWDNRIGLPNGINLDKDKAINPKSLNVIEQIYYDAIMKAYPNTKHEVAYKKAIEGGLTYDTVYTKSIK